MKTQNYKTSIKNLVHNLVIPVIRYLFLTKHIHNYKKTNIIIFIISNKLPHATKQSLLQVVIHSKMKNKIVCLNRGF
jgi:anion-transporting  ArsA/GET3 family ATPase